LKRRKHLMWILGWVRPYEPMLHGVFKKHITSGHVGDGFEAKDVVVNSEDMAHFASE
jgi:hypothetical protein